jgi:hypothetical protein
MENLQMIVGNDFERPDPLAAKFTELALKTRRVDAWEKAKALLPKETKDPMLELFEKVLEGNETQPNPKYLSQLATRYDDLREATGLDFHDPSVDHLKLITFFLREEGIIHDVTNAQKLQQFLGKFYREAKSRLPRFKFKQSTGMALRQRDRSAPVIGRRGAIFLGGGTLAAVSTGVGYGVNRLLDKIPLVTDHLLVPPPSTDRSQVRPVPMDRPAIIKPTSGHESTTDSEAVKAPEALKEPCFGVLEAKNQEPFFYKPGTGQRVILKKLPYPVEVRGYGEGPTFRYRYQVAIPGEDGKPPTILAVPISQVKIEKGEPVPERGLKPNPFFGIRVDSPDLMDRAKKMGVGKVRINAAGCEVIGGNQLEDRKLEATIKQAIKNDLEMVLTFHTNKPIAKEELERRVRCLLSPEVMGDYQKFCIELGNEPDNTEVPFWQNRDPKSFSQFIKDATEAIRAQPNGKEIPLIIGGLTYPENTAKWFGAMRKNGINLNDYQLGLHAYGKNGEIGKIETSLQYLRDFIKLQGLTSGINITELGIPKYDKIGLVDMLEYATQHADEFNIRGVLIHELANNEQDYGFVDPTDQTPYPYYYVVQRATQLIQDPNGPRM